MVFSPRRIEILKGIDWHTLIFFGAMFVLMESVWQSGTLQGLMGMADMNLKSISAILALSAVASQIVSNVPFVALYLPLLDHASSLELVALAAGSTIAGNMFILGAASNVIIIQNAEKQGETLTFWEFARIGIPLTAINLLIYYIFLTAMGF
jgi:Na+/H+ antiporter NhaD/arsenite permease-like protein